MSGKRLEKTMITQYHVTHHIHASNRPYEELIARFEAAVGDGGDGKLLNGMRALTTVDEWESLCKSLFGPSGFMQVLAFDHGKWQRLYGIAAKAKQYTYGNPILAWTMVKHDIAACSHVPFRVLIYQTAEGESRIAYDLPSTLMGHLQNAAVNEAAGPLDEKVIAFFTEIAGAAP
jgi:hypothetical protein